MVFYGLLTILGLSCRASSSNIPVPSVTPEISSNWWAAWLTHPACKTPCWQNITPGLTTRAEALSVLKNSPEFRSVSTSKYGVSWVFSRNDDEGGTLSISQDGTVDAIWIGSASDKKLLVETIVTSYNYPDCVKPSNCREGKCEALLIYSDLGMFLSTYIANTGTISTPQFEVQPDTKVDRVYFFEPGIENFQKLSFQDYDLRLKWKGYGRYP